MFANSLYQLLSSRTDFLLDGGGFNKGRWRSNDDT